MVEKQFLNGGTKFGVLPSVRTAAAAANLDRAVRKYVDRKIGRRRRDVRVKRRHAAPRTRPADEEERAAPKTAGRKRSRARTDAAPLA